MMHILIIYANTYISTSHGAGGGVRRQAVPAGGRGRGNRQGAAQEWAAQAPRHYYPPQQNRIEHALGKHPQECRQECGRPWAGEYIHI